MYILKCIYNCIIYCFHLLQPNKNRHGTHYWVLTHQLSCTIWIYMSLKIQHLLINIVLFIFSSSSVVLLLSLSPSFIHSFTHSLLLHLSLTHESEWRVLLRVWSGGSFHFFISNNTSVSLMRRNGHRHQPVSPSISLFLSVSYALYSVLFLSEFFWALKCPNGHMWCDLVLLSNDQHHVHWSDVLVSCHIHQLW